MPNEDGTATDEQQTKTGGSADQQEQTGGPQQTPSPEDLRKAQEGGQEKSAERYPEGERVEDLPDWAQRLIRQERSESASQRTARQQAEQAAQQQADERIRAVLKAAGYEANEDEDDPAKLAEAARAEREKAEADAREARVELAVYRAAPDKNADAKALLDSRSFLQSIKDLDPTDAEAVAAAVEKAVQDNPKLAVTQAATRSGADFTGGNGDGALTPEKFKALSMQQRNELYFKDPDTYRRLAAH